MAAIPRLPIHPISVKLLRQGHPWVTLDSFSRRFPVESSFIKGQDDRGMEVAVLLNDPGHKQVRARLWTYDRPWEEKQFWPEVKARLQNARNKRLQLASFQERQDRFWVFGEADALPGLMLLQLGDHFVVQFYALAWRKWMKELKALFLEIFPEISEGNLWQQARSEDGSGQKFPVMWDTSARTEKIIVDEFGVKLWARLGEAYDYGLYADMAAVRFALRPHLTGKKRVLNLYSYTGAFSLWALKLGAESAVSVDLSAKYLQWLEENLDLNDPSWKARHRSLKLPVEEALRLLKQEGQSFDFIISDPPSASSDGQKRSSALQAYEKQWDLLTELLAPGGQMLTFLNTHAVTSMKFEKHLQELQSQSPRLLKIKARLGLHDDCPTVKGFHEGNYLKGVLWG